MKFLGSNITTEIYRAWSDLCMRSRIDIWRKGYGYPGKIRRWHKAAARKEATILWLYYRQIGDEKKVKHYATLREELAQKSTWKQKIYWKFDVFRNMFRKEFNLEKLEKRTKDQPIVHLRITKTKSSGRMFRKKKKNQPSNGYNEEL